METSYNFYLMTVGFPRISMHKIFFSLLCNSCLIITFKSAVLLKEENVGFLRKNSSFCKSILLLTKASRISTYMWMFCEAFFLHKLVSSSFAEERDLRVYYFIGW
ncbi:Calcitonin gene-related peptide type 1 receptor, partial [Armadillidium vulgare]